MNVSDDAFVPGMNTPTTEYVPDSQGDPEGTVKRQAAFATPRGAAPFFILEDFDWRNRVDTATGEITWYMVAKNGLAQLVAKEAETRMDRAVQQLEDDDKVIARELAKDLISAKQTALAVDQYLPNRFDQLLMDNAAQSAAFAARKHQQVVGARSRMQPDQAEPEWLETVRNLGKQSARRAAILAYALLNVAPESTINFLNGAYNTLRMEARRNQDQYLNPDRLKDQVAHENSASAVLDENW